MRILLTVLLLFALPAQAANVWPGTDLYEGHAIVSGTTPSTRGDAIVQAFRRVLVKVSGDPSLRNDPKVDPFEAMAQGMMDDFAYQDRLSDEPHHDEQGTRDRPFDFAAHFDPLRINATLTLLGRKPYLQARPPLVIRITVEQDGHSFPMTADAGDDEQQRESLLSAAERFGIRIALPDSTAINPPPANAAVLSGTLVWRPAEGGWAGTWHFHTPAATFSPLLFDVTTPFRTPVHPAADRSWTITGVSFDDAFRDAVGGSLAALAGVAK
jgi:hypothetical protein